MAEQPVTPPSVSEAIRTALAKITPGKWLTVQRNVWADDIYVSPDEGGNPEAGALLASVATNRPAGKGNAEFIVAAPALLRAALAELERQSWQPIETAPKDGTAVLVMQNIWPGAAGGVAEECNGHNTYVAEWWENGERGRWVCYMDAVYDPTCPIEPTHWMPLPAPPGTNPATRKE